MSTTVINTLFNLPGFLARNHITHAYHMPFGASWVDKLIRYFDSETAAAAVNYPVKIEIDGIVYDGVLEVRRDGTKAVKMNH